MKINTQQKLINLNGAVLKENKTEITLGMVVCACLVGGETEAPQRAYEMAKKFTDEKEVEVSAEDILFIKKSVTDSKLPTLIKGQALTLLDI
jgi:hypothetical protein